MADAVAVLTETKVQDREVTLEIPPSGDAVTLQTILAQVREKFEARTVRIIGSWEGTTVTLRLSGSVTAADIIEELMKIRRVREAQDTGNSKRMTILLSLGDPPAVG